MTPRRVAMPSLSSRRISSSAPSGAPGVDPHRVGLPGPLGVLGLVRRLEARDLRERRGVALGLAAALGEDLVEHLELAQPERGLHVGHAGVPAALGIGLEDDVLRVVAGQVGQVHRVLAQLAQALGELGVVAS